MTIREDKIVPLRIYNRDEYQAGIDEPGVAVHGTDLDLDEARTINAAIGDQLRQLEPGESVVFGDRVIRNART